MNAFHKECLFNHFGLSNYMSQEVAKNCEICEKNWWIKPAVYQGIYHALQRRVEDELFPCLRHYSISLYAFQPLAGGFLTSRYTRQQESFKPSSQFDPNLLQVTLHRGRYWNNAYFDGLDIIRLATGKHGLTVAEVASGCIEHHSLMRKSMVMRLLSGRVVRGIWRRIWRIWRRGHCRRLLRRWRRRG